MEGSVEEVARTNRDGVAAPTARLRDAPLAKYTMLGCAVSGRPLRVTAGGTEPSYTDTDVVYVGDDDLGHARDALLVQSALIRAGSLETPIIQRLLGRPATTRRYLAVEARRALRALCSMLPGAGVERLVELGCDSGARSPVEALTLALSSSPITDPPSVFGVIRPRRVLAARLRVPGTGSDASGNGGGDVQAEDTEELGEDEEALRLGLFGRLVNGGAAGFDLSARALRALGMGREPGAGEAAPGDTGHLRHSRGTTTADPLFLLSPRPVSAEVSAPGADQPVHLAGWSYPEWDFRQQRYRPAWCTVIDLDPDSDPGADPIEPSGAHVVRHSLARVGLTRQRWRHQTSGDDIELDAVVRSRADLLAGQTPDERLYIDIRKTRRDLGVLLLLDISGSSVESSRITNNHQQQISAAAALADALIALGARVAIYAFRSQGRNSVHFLRIKAFDDQMDLRAHRRLKGLEPRWFTRLGPAVRHAHRLLRAEAGTSNLLLAVLSDGFAYDAGYEDRYAAADSRRALEEARDGGVGVICLTLGSDTAKAMLDSVFGSTVRATGDGIEALAPQLGNLCHAALASADLRRRFGRQKGEQW